MINIVSDIFKEVDIEKLHDIIETDTERVTRFCLLYQGEDIFFQLCCDRIVKLNTYWAPTCTTSVRCSSYVKSYTLRMEVLK